MTRLSEILRQLAGSDPRRKFKPRRNRRRKSLEWKDGWDVLLPAPISRFTAYPGPRAISGRELVGDGGAGEQGQQGGGGQSRGGGESGQ